MLVAVDLMPVTGQPCRWSVWEVRQFGLPVFRLELSLA